MLKFVATDAGCLQWLRLMQMPSVVALNANECFHYLLLIPYLGCQSNTVTGIC